MKRILYICSLLTAFVLCTSCSSDIEKAEQGYLKLEMNTLVNTNTRASAPAGYAPKTIYVELVNSASTVIASTNDFDNDADFNGKTFELEPGTYTVNAHSAGWDGAGSGLDAPYYAGTATVTVTAGTISTAKVTLTQNNVKVTVNWDESITENFVEATSSVESSISGVNPLVFTMGQTTQPAYFPVSDLTFALSVKNKSGQSFTQSNTFNDLNAKDHLVVTYKLAEAGSEGNVSVFVDDATHTYTWTIQIPRKSSISLDAKAVDAWSNFGVASCTVTKSATFDDNAVTLQYKKAADTEWTTVANNQLTASATGYSYKLTGLTPATPYSYRFVYATADTEVLSNEVNFTTETQTQLYNAGFENWYSEGKIAYCGLQADGKYWNSSNGGAATYVGSVTTQDTGFKHGGNSSAKLATKWAVLKLAAASLFTGDFIGLIGTKGAKLDWGVPFTSRPTALKGYYSYAPGSINRGDQPSGVGAPSKGSNDECQIFCALVTEQFHVANAEASGYEMTTGLDWENDPRVVAYGQMTQGTSSNGAWQELNIPLKYHSTTAKPTHLIIVCSASKYGDYFYGSDSSVLHLDDFEMVYGDNPTVK